MSQLGVEDDVPHRSAVYHGEQRFRRDLSHLFERLHDEAHAGAEQGEHFHRVKAGEGKVARLYARFFERDGGADGHLVVGGDHALKVGVLEEQLFDRLIAAFHAQFTRLFQELRACGESGFAAAEETFARLEDVLIAEDSRDLASAFGEHGLRGFAGGLAVAEDDVRNVAAFGISVQSHDGERLPDGEVERGGAVGRGNDDQPVHRF